MKTTETKSTQSQQHSAAETSFFKQEQDSAFFSEQSSEHTPFFQPTAGAGLQAKFASDRTPFFQPFRIPAIQMKCAACEAEEGQQQKEPSSEILTVQRMPAFESEADDHVQTKPLLQQQVDPEMEPEEETNADTELQTKLASSSTIDPPEDESESSDNSLLFTQPKLTIGHPNDRYEREADAMADQIVVQPKQLSTIVSALQTKPIAKVIISGSHHPFKLQAKFLQRRSSLQRQGDSRLTAGENIAKRLQSTRGSGSPLDNTTRSRMESAFGVDFKRVKVHTDSEAAQLNQDLGAQAFTHGADIYFNTGKYNPASHDGEHLLAHELTHTLQQGASTRLKPAELQRQEKENEDLAKELAEADREQQAAVDPGPAEQARQQADKEAVEAEQMAEEKAPTATSDKEKGKGKAKGEKAKARVVKAKHKKPDLVQPSTPEEEPKGEVGQELEQQSAGVCNQGAEKAQQLADNQQAHDEAREKLSQTESAVEPPAEEGQSRSNAGQVEALDQTPAPTTDPGAAQRERDQAIAESVPTTIEGMNEFESEGKAKVVGSRVLAQTSQEMGEIQGTYNSIETPPPAPEPEPSEALPEMEVAPGTPELNLGEGAVPELKPEQTDASEFDQQSDELLNKEGISQEQLDMVDSGDLAEANKDRKDLKQKVKDQPTEIQTFAKERQNQVKADMQKEEAQTRNVMQQKRQKELGNSQKTQQETKSKLELQREAVTKKINQIYETAKQKVTTKLNNLEKSSLKRFDQGQAKYSKLFEREVKRDINAWKRDRYSGIFGGVKWLKDKIVGIDHFPKVKRIFTTARDRYIQRIDQLIAQIDKDNNQVIKDCKAELEKAKQQIKEFVDGLGPELKKTGQAAMKDMQAKLKEMDGFINKKKEELQQKLCDKKDEAIKAIDKKIEQMKSEMGGLLGKLSKLLLKAMVKFFKWAIKKIGGNSDQLMGVLNKGESVITRIVKDPIAFFKNVAKAVGGGIKRFVANIKQHLIKGLIGWLTGAMGDAGLQLPEKFDLKGIFSLMLQILGLTWTSIRTKLAKRVGEKVVAAAEKGVDIIKRVITEGPIALWNIIKEKATEIKAQVMEGIRNWAIAQIVKKATIKLLSMLNPVGAIVQAIIAIYDVIMFFIENWDRIVAFVKSIFSSIGEIAMGQIGKAAAFIEKALAMTIPIILSFLARFLGLSGIGKAIRNVMAKVRKPVDKVVDKIVGFLAKQVKKFFKGAKKVGKRVVKALVKWWKAKKQFKGRDGKNHKLFLKGSQTTTTLMLASQPETVFDFIKRLKIEKGNSEALNAKISGKSKAQEIDKESKRKLVGATDKEKEADSKKKKDKIEKLMAELAPFVAILLGIKPEELPKSVVVYKTTTRDGELFALRTEAKILSREGEPGSPPKETNPVYQALFLRKEGNRSYYVRGHMLNDNIHGPGVLKNLTPLSQKGNKNHLEAAEKAVKIAVKSGAVVRYTIAAKYAYSVSVPSDDELQKAGVDNAEWENVKKVRKAENNVPKGLTLGADLLKRNPEGKWVKDKTLVSGKGIINPVNISLNSYQTVKGPVEKAVGLKTSSIDDLVAKTGIEKSLLEVIQSAAKSIPGSITNIHQISNALTQASGYVAAKDKLYREAFTKIINMKRTEVKLN